jgi:peroxiredoxin
MCWYASVAGATTVHSALASDLPPAAPPKWAEKAPPPMLKGTTIETGGVAARTQATDGLGETMSVAATAGAYDAAKMTYLPWRDGSAIKPLAVGAHMPAGCVVTNLRGERVNLSAEVALQPTVLIFYRGGWCPYCNVHLHDLQKSEPELRRLGYRILAVSSDTPAQIKATLAKGPLTYALFSDPHLDVAAKFGLRYQLDARYIAHVKAKPDQQAALSYVDLQAQTGGYLLTPGAFIIDATGTVRFAYVNNNYAVRVKQDVLLGAARAALAQRQ